MNQLKGTQGPLHLGSHPKGTQLPSYPQVMVPSQGDLASSSSKVYGSSLSQVLELWRMLTLSNSDQTVFTWPRPPLFYGRGSKNGVHCCFTPRDTTSHWLTPVLCAGLRTPTVPLALLPILVTTPGSKPSNQNPISPFKYKIPEKNPQIPLKIPEGLHLLIFFVPMEKKACSLELPSTHKVFNSKPTSQALYSFLCSKQRGSSLCSMYQLFNQRNEPFSTSSNISIKCEISA